MTTTTYTFDINVFSDLYKEVNNFRPRGHRFYHPETTDAERQQMWDDLLVELDVVMDEYHAQIAAADVAFEAQIAANLGYGADSRETAIRWIVEAENFTDYDLRDGFGYFQYVTNVSDKYREEVSPIMEKMLTKIST